ncbi:hypothetical protein HQQ81_02970 [Microbacteriaceae bacterium VKM Ac-2854]|nr:hypothetical protein [Microbacteriaceae bacterium VKM Ac-2854]
MSALHAGRSAVGTVFLATALAVSGALLLGPVASAEEATPTPVVVPTEVAASTPPDTDPSCTGDAAAPTIDLDAITVDWSHYGTAEVTLPPASFAPCAYSADLVLVMEQWDGGYDGGSSYLTPIPADGYAGGVVDIDVRNPGVKSIRVTVNTFGMKDGSFVLLHQLEGRTAPGVAALDAWDECFYNTVGAPDSEWTAPSLAATGAVESVSLSIGDVALPECFDSGALTVQAYDSYSNPGQAGGWVADVAKGSLADLSGTTVTAPIRAGEFNFLLQVDGTVDGIEKNVSGLSKVENVVVTAAPVVAQPTPTPTAAATPAVTATPAAAAVPAKKNLASTGVEPVMPIAIGSGLFALGMLGLLIGRRRRSAA